MTLIATVDDGRDEFIAVSDILISDDSLTPGDRDMLPLQFGIAPEFSATIGRAIRSKSLIFGNYVLLWTGNVFGAGCLIEAVTKRPPESEDEFFALAGRVQDWVLFHLKDKLPRESDALFSAILCWHDGKRFWVEQFNSKAQASDRVNLCVGGTGSEHFVEALNDSLGIHPTNIMTAVTRSVGKLMIDEITLRSHQFDVYGGGYEFITFRDGGGFRKIPYSICEISPFDHLAPKRLSYRHVSRVIQCWPSEGGCWFATAIIPHVGSKDCFNLKYFWADCFSSKPAQLRDHEPFSEPEFGISFVIDHIASSRFSSKPFAKLVSSERNLTIEYDTKAIKESSEKYTETLLELSGGRMIAQYVIVCDGCGNDFEELNYIVVRDENEIQRGERRLCDECFAQTR